MTKTYTLAEAAKLVGRSERRVWSWLQEGKIKAEKSGKSWLIDAESLLAFGRALGLKLKGDNGSSLPPPPLPVTESRPKPGRKQTGHFTFRELGAYEALRAPTVEALRFQADLPPGPAKPVADRSSQALLEALEHLTIGYHAYHLQEKITHYRLARAAACAGASGLLIAGDLAEEPRKAVGLAERLEGDPLNALSGLIRAMERKNRRGEVTEEPHGK